MRVSHIYSISRLNYHKKYLLVNLYVIELLPHTVLIIVTINELYNLNIDFH